MQSLWDQIATAIENGQWYPTHKLQHLNVKDLIEELLLVLSGMPNHNKAQFNKITKWLEREIL